MGSVVFTWGPFEVELAAWPIPILSPMLRIGQIYLLQINCFFTVVNMTISHGKFILTIRNIMLTKSRKKLFLPQHNIGLQNTNIVRKYNNNRVLINLSCLFWHASIKLLYYIHNSTVFPSTPQFWVEQVRHMTFTDNLISPKRIPYRISIKIK